MPPARERLRVEGRAAVDHDFLDSFALDVHDRTQTYARMLRELPAGLSEWAVHPGLDTEDARSLDGDGWRVRSSDHAFLVSPLARQIVREEGIRLIDYSELEAASRP